MTETDTQINNRHRAEMRDLLDTGAKQGGASQMTLAEKHRQEWVAITAERHSAEAKAEREEWAQKSKELLRKGTDVLNTVTGVRGKISKVKRLAYTVVRPGGTYVDGPHEQWEEI